MPDGVKIKSSSKKKSSKSKTTGSKKSKAKTGKPSAISKLVNQWSNDDRIRKITGIFLVVVATFIFLSGISFLVTGPHDLHLLADEELTSDTGNGFRNMMGKIGAITGKAFIHNGFGIAGLFIPFLMFLVGVKIWLRKTLLPLFKTTRLSLVGMLFIPLVIGFFFHEKDVTNGQIILTCNDNLVGSYGAFATRWAVFTLGWFGTFLSILFITGCLVIFNFNPKIAMPAFMASWFTKREDHTETADDSQQTEEPKNNLANSPRDSKEQNKTEEEEDAADAAIAQLLGDDSFEVEELPSQESEAETNTQESSETTSTPAEMEFEDATPPTPAPAKAESEEEEELEIEAAAEEQVLSEDEIDDKVQEFGEYDPKLDLSRYELPNIDLLENHGSGFVEINKEELEQNKNKIVETLNHYNIQISKIKATVGPTVTLYEIIPAPGVRISKIKNLEDDIALSLAALGIRIIAPIPGKGTIGIEVPNSNPAIVAMRTLIASDKFQNAKMELPIAIGKNISNETFCFDLAKMPHLLMAGATGQGKSVGLNAMLVSLLYKKHPSQLKFVLVDPKKVELTLFNRIERHFLAKLPDEEEAIITDTSKVVKTLNSLCVEMDDRYELLKTAQCRNLKEYNAKFIKRKLNPENGHKYLPYIVLVVDEFADLIMTAGKEVEQPIARLAQLARAIGIHLIIATQRPSVNIITGTIKANFPARIAFRVTSKIDSRTILDAGGADQLIGRGDMLLSTGNDLIRLQCGFVDTPEVEEITDFIGTQQGYPEAFLLPEYEGEGGGEIGNLADEDRDELFHDAARVIVMHQQGSASLLQRKLKLGYNRAGRLIDQLENAGIIGPFEGSKARKVLVPDEMSLEQLLNNGA